jgi:hypothetical protein
VFVRACERIVGPDLEAEAAATDTSAADRRDPERSAA